MKPTKTIRPIALLLLVLFVSSGMLYANNIQVSNTKLTGQNTTDGYTQVQFDLSRENLWHTISAPLQGWFPLGTPT